MLDPGGDGWTPPDPAAGIFDPPRPVQDVAPAAVLPVASGVRDVAPGPMPVTIGEVVGPDFLRGTQRVGSGGATVQTGLMGPADPAAVAVQAFPGDQAARDAALETAIVVAPPRPAPITTPDAVDRNRPTGYQPGGVLAGYFGQPGEYDTHSYIAGGYGGLRAGAPSEAAMRQYLDAPAARVLEAAMAPFAQLARGSQMAFGALGLALQAALQVEAPGAPGNQGAELEEFQRHFAARGGPQMGALDQLKLVAELAGEAWDHVGDINVGPHLQAGPVDLQIGLKGTAEFINPAWWALPAGAGLARGALVARGIDNAGIRFAESFVANAGMPYADRAIHAALVNSFTRGAARSIRATLADISSGEILNRTGGTFGAGQFERHAPQPRTAAFALPVEKQREILGLSRKDPSPAAAIARLTELVKELDSADARRAVLGPSAGLKRGESGGGMTHDAAGKSEHGGLIIGQGSTSVETAAGRAYRAQYVDEAKTVLAEYKQTADAIDTIDRSKEFAWGQLDPEEQLRQLAIDEPAWEPYLAAYRNAQDDAERASIIEAGRGFSDTIIELHTKRDGVPFGTESWYRKPGDTATALLAEREVLAARLNAKWDRVQAVLANPPQPPRVASTYTVRQKSPRAFEILNADRQVVGTSRSEKDALQRAFDLSAANPPTMVPSEIPGAQQAVMPGTPGSQAPALELTNQVAGEHVGTAQGADAASARMAQTAGGQQLTIDSANAGEAQQRAIAADRGASPEAALRGTTDTMSTAARARQEAIAKASADFNAADGISPSPAAPARFQVQNGQIIDTTTGQVHADLTGQTWPAALYAKDPARALQARAEWANRKVKAGTWDESRAANVLKPGEKAVPEDANVEPPRVVPIDAAPPPARPPRPPKGRTTEARVVDNPDGTFTVTDTPLRPDRPVFADRDSAVLTTRLRNIEAGLGDPYIGREGVTNEADMAAAILHELNSPPILALMTEGQAAVTRKALLEERALATKLAAQERARYVKAAEANGRKLDKQADAQILRDARARAKEIIDTARNHEAFVKRAEDRARARTVGPGTPGDPLAPESGVMTVTSDGIIVPPGGTPPVDHGPDGPWWSWKNLIGGAFRIGSGQRSFVLAGDPSQVFRQNLGAFLRDPASWARSNIAYVRALRSTDVGRELTISAIDERGKMQIPNLQLPIVGGSVLETEAQLANLHDTPLYGLLSRTPWGWWLGHNEQATVAGISVVRVGLARTMIRQEERAYGRALTQAERDLIGERVNTHTGYGLTGLAEGTGALGRMVGERVGMGAAGEVIGRVAAGPLSTGAAAVLASPGFSASRVRMLFDFAQSLSRVSYDLARRQAPNPADLDTMLLGFSYVGSWAILTAGLAAVTSGKVNGDPHDTRFGQVDLGTATPSLGVPTGALAALGISVGTYPNGHVYLDSSGGERSLVNLVARLATNKAVTSGGNVSTPWTPKFGDQNVLDIVSDYLGNRTIGPFNLLYGAATGKDIDWQDLTDNPFARMLIQSSISDGLAASGLTRPGGPIRLPTREAVGGQVGQWFTPANGRPSPRPIAPSPAGGVWRTLTPATPRPTRTP